jgi:hypothetical protein
MAREISEIKKTMTDAFITDATVIAKYELQVDKTFDEQFSKASIENIWFYCAAMGIWALECLFDLFKKQTDKKIAELKPHTAKWYANKIKAFQHGDELPWDTDIYPVIDAAKQIVGHCSVADTNGMLFVKVAKADGGDLAPLNSDEQSGLKSYIDRVRDAGVVFVLRSHTADMLNLQLMIHFDPLVLNKSGKRTDGSNDTPVQDAINNYLKNLPFNGEYSNMALIDSIRTVAGVRVAQLLMANAKKHGDTSNTPISSVYIPNAGYMRLNSASITYVPHDS